MLRILIKNQQLCVAPEAMLEDLCKCIIYSNLTVLMSAHIRYGLVNLMFYWLIFRSCGRLKKIQIVMELSLILA